MSWEKILRNHLQYATFRMGHHFFEILIKFDSPMGVLKSARCDDSKTPPTYMLNLMKFWLRYLKLKTTRWTFFRVKLVFEFQFEISRSLGP